MICQLIQETLSALIQNDAFHILHLKNFQPHFLSALTRANSPGTKFLGETFENRNMLGNRNGQSLFASNSYSQGPTPFQKAHQAEKLNTECLKRRERVAPQASLYLLLSFQPLGVLTPPPSFVV